MSSQKTVTNATPLVDRLEFTKGVSSKTGNEYLIGSCYIKSPISQTPIRLDIGYLDDNARALIGLALDGLQKESEKDFADGIK